MSCVAKVTICVVWHFLVHLYYAIYIYRIHVDSYLVRVETKRPLCRSQLELIKECIAPRSFHSERTLAGKKHWFKLKWSEVCEVQPLTRQAFATGCACYILRLIKAVLKSITLVNPGLTKISKKKLSFFLEFSLIWKRMKRGMEWPWWLRNWVLYTTSGFLKPPSYLFQPSRQLRPVHTRELAPETRSRTRSG